jgi:hypothetical protein
MSDDNKQNESELQFEDTSESDSSTDEQSTTQGSEETHDDLELEDKANIAEANRNKQIDVWFNRVSSGEITIEQIPANLGWVKKAVENKLGIDTSSVSTEEIVKQVLEKERAEEDFKNLFTQLKSQNINSSQQDLVKSKYNALLANGMTNKALALETAIAASGIELKTPKDIRRENMALPKASYYTKPTDADKITKNATWDDLAGVSQLSPAERAKYYAKLTK